MAMSKSLKKTLPFLKIVSKVSKKNRNNLLKEVGGDPLIFKALNEISHNYLRKKHLVKEQHLVKKLKSKEKYLKKFCDKDNYKCIKKRRKIIQSGSGILPLLIPAIISLISALK